MPAQIIKDVATLRRVLHQHDGADRNEQSDGKRVVSLVPTMGALHEGHLTLIREAAAVSDEVVVSIFVNPLQFTDASDLAAYPRTEEQDAELAAAAGATVLFIPTPEEVYPSAPVTSVHVSGVSEPWEGAVRGAAHFDGVAIVVVKLLNMVSPDIAWFGQKDAQQVAVVRRVVTDLSISVEIRTVATVRDADGLALSSRNVRLSPEDRRLAPVLHQSLAAARDAAAAGERDAAALSARAHEFLRAAGVEPEYWAIVDPDTLIELRTLDDRPALAIVAAPIGPVRLLDNEPIPGYPE